MTFFAYHWKYMKIKTSTGTTEGKKVEVVHRTTLKTSREHWKEFPHPTSDSEFLLIKVISGVSVSGLLHFQQASFLSHLSTSSSRIQYNFSSNTSSVRSNCSKQDRSTRQFCTTNSTSAAQEIWQSEWWSYIHHPMILEWETLLLVISHRVFLLPLLFLI